MSDRERVIARLRSHGRALTLPVILLWVIVPAAMLALDRVDWSFWNITVLTVAGILVLLLCVVPTLAWLSRRTVLTTRRIIVRAGFGGARREVPYGRVIDVELRRRGMQGMFGSGDLLLSTGGERPLALTDVPSAALVQRTIVDLLDRTPREPS